MSAVKVQLKPSCEVDYVGIKLAFRIDEAVAASGLSRSTLYALISAGTLPSVRVAGRRLILKNDLVALLSGRADA